MSPNPLPAIKEVGPALRALGRQKAVLELAKPYKGLALQQDVRILEVHAQEAVFRTTNIEMSVALEGDVYLHSQSLPRVVEAKVVSQDLRKDELVLSRFAYTSAEWKKRQHERVEPKHPIQVTLHWKGRAVRECIENLSASGMGIYACKTFEKGMRLQPDSYVHLDFQLSPYQQYTGCARKGCQITSGRAER